AGDHSCKPAEIASAFESSSWPGKLLVNARDLSLRMRAPGITNEERVDAWRDHNLALQDIDPLLVSRAQSNAAHFLRPLDDEAALDRYVERSLTSGTSLNAVAAYAHYHLLALRIAQQAARGCAHDDHARWTCDDEAAAHLKS